MTTTNDAARRMLSTFKGLAACSFPAAWLDDFGLDGGWHFAQAGWEARIRFPAGGYDYAAGEATNYRLAFAIWIEQDGPEVHAHARRLTRAEIAATEWREFGAPFEAYETLQVFGRSSVVLRLDELPPPLVPAGRCPQGHAMTRYESPDESPDIAWCDECHAEYRTIPNDWDGHGRLGYIERIS